MNNLMHFIHDFLNKKGQYVFISLLVGKVCAFLSSLLIIRLLPQNEFGIITIVVSIFAVFVPMSGLGSAQSLLRFGSILNEEDDKKNLSNTLMINGMMYQFVICSVFFLLVFFLDSSFENIWIYFVFFALRLLGFYFYQHIQSFYRVIGDNKKFATISNMVNISGLLLVGVFTYIFGVIGYLIAISITPFISLLFYSDQKWDLKFSFFNKKQTTEIFKYGLHSSGTALLSDLLFSLDVLMLGFWINENAVADYKVALLLPANITFLSIVFLQTSFPSLANHYQDKKYLKEYVFNYYKIFIPVTLIIMLVGYFGSDLILNIVFGKTYSDSSLFFTILLATFLGNMLLRNLFGNLLSAVGQVKKNTYVSLFSVLTLLLLSYILLPLYGALGMVISLSTTLFLSGLLYAYYFIRYLKSLKS